MVEVRLSFWCFVISDDVATSLAANTGTGAIFKSTGIGFKVVGKREDNKTLDSELVPEPEVAPLSSSPFESKLFFLIGSPLDDRVDTAKGPLG